MRSSRDNRFQTPYVCVASVGHINDEQSSSKAYCVEIPYYPDNPQSPCRRIFIPKAHALIADDMPNALHPRCLYVRRWLAKKEGLLEMENPLLEQEGAE